MIAPVNVKSGIPTRQPHNWPAQAQEWRDLNAQAGGNPAFCPLTIKAAYVIGIIYDLCDTVARLLRYPNARDVTYLPAFGIFSAGMELLGRCINGNDGIRHNPDDLKAGLGRLGGATPKLPDDVILTTSTRPYTINELADARPRPTTIDTEILAPLPPMIAGALEWYWNELQASEGLCNKLAANVIALRGWPVLRTLLLMERDQAGVHHSITEIFGQFEW